MMKITLNWEIILVIAVIVFFLIFLVRTYNKLTKARIRVRTQSAQIEVQLKRRFDMIPNLVECVKGYAKHESDTLEKVIAARSKFTGTNFLNDIEAYNQLSTSLPKIFAIAEAYPDLKANTVFINLQTELSETESKIAFARQFYNDTVMLYSNLTETFPTVIIAALFKFGKEPFFKIDADQRENVQIKL